LAQVPPGAIPIESVPQALDGPVMGTPATSSLIDHARYWQVSMSFADALAWVKAHPPLGLVSGGSSSGGGPDERSAGFGYQAADSPAWTGAMMEIGVGSVSADVTDIRADGVAEWFDPVPLRDTATGPRIRVTVAAGCPESDADDVGVLNNATDLDSSLLPSTAPSGGLICEYNGLNGRQFGLLTSTPLGAGPAGQLADSVNRGSLSHLDGVETSCPMEDDSTTVVVMSYPGRADVDLWYARTGCQSVSNGVITGSPSEVLDELGNPAASGPPVQAAVSSS
jgi:hypothetical protein